MSIDRRSAGAQVRRLVCSTQLSRERTADLVAGAAGRDHRAHRRRAAHDGDSRGWRRPCPRGHEHPPRRAGRVERADRIPQALGRPLSKAAHPLGERKDCGKNQDHTAEEHHHARDAISAEIHEIGDDDAPDPAPHLENSHSLAQQLLCPRHVLRSCVCHRHPAFAQRPCRSAARISSRIVTRRHRPRTSRSPSQACSRSRSTRPSTARRRARHAACGQPR